MTLELRRARDGDSPGIVALVGLCFAEYPGCILDVDEEERGLLAPETAFSAFWVLAEGDRVRGTIACQERLADADGPRRVELKKLYLHPRVRGRGLARRLCGLVEDWAREHGHDLVDLWTDTRFRTAHAVYEHLGYVRTGRIRALDDRSATREYHFVKELAPAG